MSDRSDLENLIAGFKAEFDNLLGRMATAGNVFFNAEEEKAPSHPDGYYLPELGGKYHTPNEDEAQKEAYKKMVLAIYEENVRTGFVVDLKDAEQTLCYFGINRDHSVISIHKTNTCIPCHPRECFSIASDMKLKELLGEETIKLAKGWN